MTDDSIGGNAPHWAIAALLACTAQVATAAPPEALWGWQTSVQASEDGPPSVEWGHALDGNRHVVVDGTSSASVAVTLGVTPLPFINATAAAGGEFGAARVDASILYGFEVVAKTTADADALKTHLLSTPGAYANLGSGLISGDGVVLSGFHSLATDRQSFSGAIAFASLGSHYALGDPIGSRRQGYNWSCTADGGGTDCGVGSFGVAGGLTWRPADPLVFSGAVDMFVTTLASWAVVPPGGFGAGALARAYLDPVITLAADSGIDPSHYEIVLSDGIGNVAVLPPAVPEPATFWLAGLGCGALWLVRRRGARR